VLVDLIGQQAEPKANNLVNSNLKSDQGKLSSFGAGLSVKVDMSIDGAVWASSNTLTSSVVEKAAELDLRDLESSVEEDESVPSGGCTGEPTQQKRKKLNYKKGEQRRYFDEHLGLPLELYRKDSQQSAAVTTSSISSETCD